MIQTNQTRGWLRPHSRYSNSLPPVDQTELPYVEKGGRIFGGLTPTLAAMLPEGETRRAEIKKDLVAAGYYSPHAFNNLSAIRYLGLMIPILIMLGLLVVVPPRLEFYIFLPMLMLAALGWAIPTMIVRGQANERRSEIERSLPDMVDMINMCVSQGMTLNVALARVCRELGHVYPSLARELQIVEEQSRLGTLEQALQNFIDRIDVPDIRSFCTLLIQTERMGTSITVALRDYADSMRASLRQRADEKANRATFQLLFPTVLCLMPAVYLFLLGPSIIELSEFFYGENQVLDNASNALREYNAR